MNRIPDKKIADHADDIDMAVKNAGRTVNEHTKARAIISSALAGTKVPRVKLCDTYLNIEDQNRPPQSLSNEAVDVFGRLTDLMRKSSRDDLSDIADDFALSHDIKLLP